MDNNFYVYMYMDQDNCPFYIGKGKKLRYYPANHTYSNANTMTSNKIKSIGIDNIKVHFLHKDISEEDSFKWEAYWIAYLGRIDNGTGQLTNHTDGGEGVSGYIHSEETKLKMSNSLKDHKYNTAEVKEKISNSLKGHKGYWLGKKFSDEHKQNMKGPRVPRRK